MEVIGVCGLGYSGSGAVVDLLKEYSELNCECCDDEFLFLYYPDGIDDLYYHLMTSCARFQSSDVAISRFLSFIETAGKVTWNKRTKNTLMDISKELLRELVQVSWYGNWEFDEFLCYQNFWKYVQFRIKRKTNSILCKYKLGSIEFIKKRKMYFSIMPDNILEAINHFTENVIKACLKDKDSDIVILNQPFPANNPEQFMKYISNSKAIVVIRDPRDVYLSLKKVNSNNTSWYPSDNIDNFIVYYEKLSQNINKSHEKIKIIRFEDLIYNYKQTVKDIEKFIGIEGHIRNIKYFYPDVSINNTQLFRAFPEYRKEINEIERRLTKYCYPFDNNVLISHDYMF